MPPCRKKETVTRSDAGRVETLSARGEDDRADDESTAWARAAEMGKKGSKMTPLVDGCSSKLGNGTCEGAVLRYRGLWSRFGGNNALYSLYLT